MNALSLQCRPLLLTKVQAPPSRRHTTRRTVAAMYCPPRWHRGGELTDGGRHVRLLEEPDQHHLDLALALALGRVEQAGRFSAVRWDASSRTVARLSEPS